MAIRSLVQLRGYFEGLPSGSRNIAPADMIDLASPATVLNVQLLSGDNTISIPATANGVIIVFDSRSTIIKILKQNASDVGIELALTGWMVLSLSMGAQADFIINASADDDDGGGTPVPYTTEIMFF